MTPTGGFLAAEGIHEGWDQARQNLCGAVPTYVVKQLAGLVGKVECVALVHEKVVGRCCKEKVGDLRRGQSVGDGRAQRPLRGIGAARLGEAAKPVAEDSGAGLGGDQRVQVEVGRPSFGVTCDVDDAVIECPSAV